MFDRSIGHLRSEWPVTFDRNQWSSSPEYAHDWNAWQDVPLSFPRILRYVAVDETRKDRLVFENGVPERMVTLLPNGVDTERYRPRGPLPLRPERGLLFSNYVRGDKEFAELRQACSRVGMSLDVVGAGVGRPEPAPERLLPQYDVIFAMGRSALEAMAVGCGVVIWGLEGLGGFVHTGNFSLLQRSNFGRRALRPATAARIEAEIRQFDARQAQAVQYCVRETLNQVDLVDRHLALYDEVITEAAVCTWDTCAELRLAAQYIRQCVPHLQVEAQQTKEQRRIGRQRRRLLEAGWLSLVLLVLAFGIGVEKLAFEHRTPELIFSTIPICLLLFGGIYLLRAKLRGSRIL